MGLIINDIYLTNYKILYSHIFYANCLGFIKNENMEKYVCDEMTCIQMLEKDLNFIKDYKLNVK